MREGKRRYASGQLEAATAAWTRARHLLCLRLARRTPGLREGRGGRVTVNNWFVQQLLHRLVAKSVQLLRMEVRNQSLNVLVPAMFSMRVCVPCK